MRKAIAILLALGLALTLTGCHGSRGMEAFVMPEELDTSRDFEVTFWAKNDTNRTQTEIYAAAIADFEKAYPNIHVNLRLYTDYGKIYNDVITNIATRTTPNVCITYPDHIATYLTGVNVMVPLDTLFGDENYGLGGSKVNFDGVTAAEIVPEYLQECTFDGHTWALPYMRSTEACYINKTYVEALGYTLPETLTWDFIWEVSEAAMAQDADGNYLVNGQKVLIPFIYKSTDNMMIQYTAQTGTGYADAEGNVGLFNDATADFLRTVADHTATGAFSTFKISGYPGNFLNAGQCIFAVDSTAGSTWMGSHAPLSDIAEENLAEFETAVMTVPQANPDCTRMISQGPSVCVFNKEDPQEVLASWLFAQFLLTDGVQTAYAETEGYVPVTTSARSCEAYLDYLSRAGEDDALHYSVKLAASKLLLEHTADTFTTPVFSGSASLRDAAGQLIEDTVKAVRRGQSVDENYFAGLYGNVISLYRLDQQGDRNAATEKAELGPLPAGSRALLWSLAAVWALLGGYLLVDTLKKRRNRSI